MNFRVTPAAAGEILAAAERSGAQGMALRVAARAMPDGIDYGMGFDDAAPDDDVGMVSGLTVLVGGPSRELLAGTVLDFVEIEPGRRDFIFVPPGRLGLRRRAAGPREHGWLRQRRLLRVQQPMSNPTPERKMP